MATALVFTGASIEIYCMLSINKGTNIKRLKITLLFLTLLSIILFTTLNRNIITRAVVVSTFLSVIFSYLFIELSVKKGNSKMQNITGWIALTFVLVNIIRGTYIMFTRIELPINSTVHVQIMLSLISVIVAFAFPLLFLFILKEKDNNKLQELNNTKDKLFSIIGHDLKGPIAQMIQFAHLIEDSSIDLSKEELLMYIKKLKESSIQGYKLLENLLEWGCSQTGSISFTPTSFSINESIIENIELLSKQAETKNIKISTTFNYNGKITADRNMINTVIRNLLSNAIKFTYQNGVIVISNRIEIDYITISVKDNGLGMSCEDLNKLYKINTSYTTVGTNNEKGTGIGLILCKEFVDRHMGKIWAESKINNGSTFSFSIPTK